jgi:hypothetical protein
MPIRWLHASWPGKEEKCLLIQLLDIVINKTSQLELAILGHSHTASVVTLSIDCLEAPDLYDG